MRLRTYSSSLIGLLCVACAIHGSRVGDYLVASDRRRDPIVEATVRWLQATGRVPPGSHCLVMQDGPPNRRPQRCPGSVTGQQVLGNDAPLSFYGAWSIGVGPFAQTSNGGVAVIVGVTRLRPMWAPSFHAILVLRPQHGVWTVVPQESVIP
jgi:hypothetical protein